MGLVLTTPTTNGELGIQENVHGGQVFVAERIFNSVVEYDSGNCNCDFTQCCVASCCGGGRCCWDGQYPFMAYCC